MELEVYFTIQCTLQKMKSLPITLHFESVSSNTTTKKIPQVIT